MINSFLQRQLIFHPRKLAKAYKYKLDKEFEEHDLPTEDGASINLLVIKTPSKRPRGVVLYFHGNADNLKRWSLLHTEFTQRGYDFVVYDYRSFGKSTGYITEENCYQDAEMIFQFVKKRYLHNKIVLYGRSLGTAIATHIAKANNSKLLVLETPFHNMKGILKMHAPILPLPEQLAYRFPIDEYLPKVACPVIIFQGTKDRIVPFAAAQQLKPLLKQYDKFIVIEGGKHKNLKRFKPYINGLNKHLGAPRKLDLG